MAQAKKPAIKATKKSESKKSKKIQDARLVLIWDRSGSMASLQNDAIGAFNEFVKQQKELKGKTTLSFFIFDTTYDTIHLNVDINDVPELTNKVYFARGGTALLDAVGKTLNTFKASEKKGEKTIVAIMTDGEENSSREYTNEAVKKLVKEVQDLGWEVQFLGANIDSFAVGGSMGIAAGTTVNYDFSNTGIVNAVRTMAMKSNYTRGAYAGAAAAAFEDTLDANGEVQMDKLYEKVKKNEIKTK